MPPFDRTDKLDIENRRKALQDKVRPEIPIIGPYWTTTDGDTARLYLGHVLACLAAMPTRSVQSIVTSPPYWALRDYKVDKRYAIGSEPLHDCETKGQAQCGCYVCVMVKVFRGLRRVLRHDGTVWVNLGDSYGSGTGNNPSSKSTLTTNGGKGPKPGDKYANDSGGGSDSKIVCDLPSGNLMGMPWRVALALQADGWVLRQDIVWHKVNPMPESVDSRCTKSHEYVFLLTKSMDYFYDAEAVREEGEGYGRGAGKAAFRSNIYTNNAAYNNSHKQKEASGAHTHTFEGGRNKRSVWSVDDEQALVAYLRENNPEIIEQFLADARNKSDVWRVASQPYPGAHYATFPKKLIEPCILAGTSTHGACVECGAPWYRWVGKVTKDQEWRPTCHCKCDEVRPCIVLDPFVGSGTTIEVCIENDRWGWGIDLSEVYLKNNAIPRISACIRERPALRHLLSQHEVKRVVGGRSSKPPPSS